MVFDGSLVTDSDAAPWEYVSIPLIICDIGWKSEETNGTLRYKAWINKNDKETRLHKLKLNLLAPLTGKQPRELPLMLWYYSKVPQFTLLSSELRDLFIRKMADSGFNYSLIRSLDVEKFRTYGIKGFAMLPTITITSHFPYAAEFVKKHPEFAGRYPDGRIANTIDPAYLLQKDCLFHKYIRKVFAAHLKVFPDSMNWDYEFSFMNPKVRRTKIGFSKRNLELFRKFAKIAETEKLDSGLIYSKYTKQWIKFRCAQNGAVSGLYRKIIKEINPDCLYSFYAGYPPYSDTRQGIDWKSMSENVDLPMCGYGGNNALMLKTVRQKYFCEGILLWSYVDQLPMENAMSNLLASAGSYLSFLDFVVDGRYFLSCSRAAAIAADFENFFLNLKGNQHDELVTGEDGEPRKDVKVLTNGEKRLLLVFNYSGDEKQLVIHNKSLSEHFIAIGLDTKTS
jgi:hypothetical protein